MESVTTEYHEGVLLRTYYRLCSDDHLKYLTSRKPGFRDVGYVPDALRLSLQLYGILVVLQHSRLAQANALRQLQQYRGWTPIVRASRPPAHQVRE